MTPNSLRPGHDQVVLRLARSESTCIVETVMPPARDPGWPLLQLLMIWWRCPWAAGWRHSKDHRAEWPSSRATTRNDDWCVTRLHPAQQPSARPHSKSANHDDSRCHNDEQSEGILQQREQMFKIIWKLISATNWTIWKTHHNEPPTWCTRHWQRAHRQHTNRRPHVGTQRSSIRAEGPK